MTAEPIYGFESEDKVPLQKMAAILGISERRVQQLVADFKMPKLGHGLYPLQSCILWYIKFWEDKALGREANDAKKIKEDSAATLMRIKAEEAAGLVINRSEIVSALSNAFAAMGQWLDQVPTIHARKTNGTPESQRQLRALLDEGRAAFVRNVSEYMDPVEDAD